MVKVLITGATGNVGKEVVRHLSEMETDCEINICMRNTASVPPLRDSGIKVREFDFEKPETFGNALRDTDILFLLRPPHIADAEGCFRPLLSAARESGVEKVVFLSVQGADRTPYIPHAKIEKIIRELDFSYVFLRPSYFMQNFTTTLRQDVREGTVVLPAGNALFNWIDVADIGEAAARVIAGFDRFSGSAIELTGSENKSFGQAIDEINRTIGSSLKYRSVNLISFFRHKRRQGVSRPMIMVMIMLHFLPRFQKPPRISTAYTELTGRKPATLSDFAKAEADIFLRG